MQNAWAINESESQLFYYVNSSNWTPVQCSAVFMAPTYRQTDRRMHIVVSRAATLAAIEISLDIYLPLKGPHISPEGT